MRFSPAISLRVSARRSIIVLSLIAGTLVVANLATLFVRFGLGHSRFFGINRLFDLDGEGNIPALFSTVLFFLNSALLFVVAKIHPQLRELSSRRCWWLLAGVFLFLAVDENASVHELLMDLVPRHLKVGGVFYFAWVIPYGIATLAFATVLLRWFWGLNRLVQWRFAIAAIVFLSGALGMEMLSGCYLQSVHDDRNRTYYLLVTVEESLEMAGLIVFAFSLLKVLENHCPGTTVLVTIAAKPIHQRSAPSPIDATALPTENRVLPR